MTPAFTPTADWTDALPDLAALDPRTRARLAQEHPVSVPAGAVLFRPGEAVKGYVLVLEGRVSAHLVGPSGRGIVLYRVAAGQSCIQSSLGLLGGDDAYSAEAVADMPCRLVILPRALFLELVDASAGFRSLVFAALADRMQEMMRLAERMTFGRVSERLARLLLELAGPDGHVAATQDDLAQTLGTAREVVARNLAALEGGGLVRRGRGRVVVADRAGLGRIAAGGT
ncbi:MAG: Crp/Fnr family transcriptional regulator [Rhodobacteraceae bacterium]|nr:Crp/Fnr family transcriptional regulator [Paracoccaceae bacterium]